jgi:hypothetical protein
MNTALLIGAGLAGVVTLVLGLVLFAILRSRGDR